jgi:hypothetical protein
MGKRSGCLDTEAEVMAASLAEVDAWIGHLERRAASPLASGLRKAAASHAYWLRKMRAHHPKAEAAAAG